MLFHYVYVIENLVNHKKYVGSHGTDNLNDGYLGSGIAITRAIEQYGSQNFSKVILEHTTKESQFITEQKWLDTIQPACKNDWYNCKNTATGGNTRENYTTEQLVEYSKKLTSVRKGKPGRIQSESEKNKRSATFTETRKSMKQNDPEKHKLWVEKTKIAARNNLKAAAAANCKKITLKCIWTAEILQFKSITGCMTHFWCGRSAVHTLLRKDKQSKHPLLKNYVVV